VIEITVVRRPIRDQEMILSDHELSSYHVNHRAGVMEMTICAGYAQSRQSKQL
jgi:hypothetical protein